MPVTDLYKQVMVTVMRSRDGAVVQHLRSSVHAESVRTYGNVLRVLICQHALMWLPWNELEPYTSESYDSSDDNFSVFCVAVRSFRENVQAFGEVFRATHPDEKLCP